MRYQDLCYNDVRQKSAHNAFQRHEGIYDQIVYWRIRSLEIDLWRTKRFHSPLSRDWYVYHFDFDALTSVDTLQGFLRICRGVQKAMPDHEVITLFLDVKQRFHTTASASQSGRRFDELLSSELGDAIYRPADLLATAPGASSLRDAVQQVGWPRLVDLRGRFLVVLTGKDEDLASYAATSREPMVFRSALVDRASDVPGGDENVVFYNMHANDVAHARKVYDEGFVSRAYYLDEPGPWDRAVDSRCHHLATDMVNSRTDTWSKTASGVTGFPFQPFEGSAPPVSEPGSLCGVWARSGDVWDTSDSLEFFYRYCRPGHRDNHYELYICNPNSHVDDWIKGGVIARNGLGPGAPYFGVFRVGEKHGLRVQYRLRRDAPTMSVEIRPDSQTPFYADTLVFVRLRITRDGRRARGWTSVDGTDWEEVADVELDVPLTHQGIGVSAHDQQRGAKFLFGVPDGVARPVFTSRALIGPRNDDDRGWAYWFSRHRWRVTDFGAP